MNHSKRLTRLMHAAAEQAAPGDLDLWPAIRARLQPQAATPPRHIRGAITLIVVLMIVIAAGLILALHGNQDRDPVHTASLNQTADPQIAPAAYLPTPVPTQQFCEAYASYDEDKTLYREPDANSRAVFNPIHAGSPLIVWDDQEVNGETWYNVSLYYYQVEFRGWVQGKPTELYECGKFPAAYPGVADSGAYPIYITYADEALNIAVKIPAGWIPYRDLVLDQPDLKVTALSFYESAEDVGPFDPGNLPTHGSAIIVINGQDRSVFTEDEPGHALPAANLLRPLLGYLPELDPARTVTFYRDQGDAGITLYLLLTPPDSDLSALSASLFWPMLESAGITLLETTHIEGADFSPEGVYTHTGALTREDPVHNYGIIGFSMPADDLSKSDGYVIVSVEGADYTPNLYVEKDGRDTFQVLSQTWTNDGAIMMQWVKNGRQEPVTYNASVEGMITTKLGGYTFCVRPVTDVIDLSKGPQDVHLDYRQPQVVRYAPGEGGQVRLNIAVGQWMEASDVPAPDVAVILPDGVTLTRFNPDQTPQLNLSFTPAPDSAPLILFYPLDTDLNQDRREIALYVSAEAQGSAAFTPGTTSELGGTILLPEGTVAISIPSSGYVVMDGDAAGLVGQTVSVSMSFLYVDVDDQTQMPLDSGTSLPALLSTGGEGVVQQVTQTVIQQAIVVSAGPYLAPFSNDDPGLEWATGQEVWGVITLAMSPQDAITLQWAVEAQIPVILSRAD